jgi:hypothetical protein
VNVVTAAKRKWKNGLAFSFIIVGRNRKKVTHRTFTTTRSHWSHNQTTFTVIMVVAKKPQLSINTRAK